MKAVTLSGLCRIARISRQGFYRGRRERRRRQLDAEGMVAAVQQERRSQPRLGTRKLQIRLAQAGLAVGRDALFAVLRDRGLLVTPKRKQVRTTYHDPNLPVYRNLLYQLEPTQVHQVWVSDITGVSTDEGWLYLSLIADKISHHIVGWHAGETLEAGESIKALDRAIAQLPANRWPIHHSDRGSQYCCHEYVAVLNARGLPISMTEANHCYENAQAERLNGILKGEFNLDAQFRTRTQARRAIAQAIATYNLQRPHLSLSMRTPNEVHRPAA